MTFLTRALILWGVGVLFLSVNAAPAGAQHGGWFLDVSAGRAVHDPLSVAVGSSTASVGLRYEDAPSWLYVAGGVPFAPDGVHWGMTGVGGRLDTTAKGISLGVDLEGHLFGYAQVDDSFSGRGATLLALPGVTGRYRAAEWAVHSGVVQHTDQISGASETRRAHDTGMRFTVARGNALVLGGQGRFLRAPEGDFPYAGGGIQLRRGRAALWGTAGRWLTDEISTPALGGGAGIQVDRATEVHLEWQQDPTDPVYRNLPRRAWSLRISRKLGSAPAHTLFPVRAHDGRITLRIPVDVANSAPYLLGDFTGWKPVRMTRTGPFWAVTLTIPSGTYYYGFKHADGTWFVPPSVPQQVDDGMGGTTALLVVS